MAEASLDLDVTPALASIDEIDVAFTDIVAKLNSDLGSAITDALSPQISEITTQFDDMITQISGQLSGGALTIDTTEAITALDDVSTSLTNLDTEFANIQPPDFSGLDTALQDTGGEMDSVGESTGETTSKFNLQEGATSALELATGALEGKTGSLFTRLLPGAAIFGGITAAIGGLIEKGDRSILSTERLNTVFGDQAPIVFDQKINGVNLSLGELDTKSGSSNSAMRLLTSTFGETAIGAGATKTEAAGAAQTMGFISAALTTLNPSLGTADQNFQMITRGLGGSTRILQRYGITIDSTRLASLALDNAHAHGRETANLYDKQMAGATLTMEALQQKAKDAGMTLEEFLNKGLENSTVKFRALKAQVSASLTEIGKPIVEAGLAITQAFTPAITGVIRLFGGLVDAIVPLLAPLATKFGQALQPLIDKIPQFVEGAKPVIAALGEVFRVLFTFITPIIGAFGDLGTAGGSAIKQPLIDFLHGVADGLRFVRDIIGDVVVWLQDHLAPAFDFLSRAAGNATDSLGGTSGIADVLGKAAVGGGVLYAAFNTLGPVVTQVGDAIGGLQTIFTALTSPIGLVVIAIAAVAAGAVYLYSTWQPFHDLVDKLATYFTDTFLPALQNIGQAILDWLLPALQTVGSYLTTSFIPDMISLADTISNGITSAINTLMPYWDGFVSGLDSIVNSTIFQGMIDLATSFWDLLSPMGQVILVVGLVAAAITILPLGAVASLIGAVVAAVAGLVLAFGALQPVFNAIAGSNIFQSLADLATSFWDLLGPIGQVVAVIGLVGLAIGVLPFGIVTSVIGLLVAAVAGLIIGFGALYNGVQPVRDIVDTVVSRIGDLVGVIIDAAGPALEQIGQAVAGAVAQFDALWPKIEQVGSVIITVIAVALSPIIAALAILGDFILNALGPAFDFLEATVITVFQALGDIISGAIDVIMGILQVFFSILTGDWQGAWDGIQQILSGAWQIITGIFEGAFGMIENIFGLALGILGALWVTAWDTIKVVLSTVWDAMSAIVSAVINLISGIISGALGVISAIWSTAWNVISTVFSTVWNAIQAVVNAIFSAIALYIQTELNIISTVWNTIWNVISTVFTAIWNTISATVIAIFTAIWNFIQTTLNTINAVWNTIWNAIAVVANTIWNTIWNIITAAINAVLNVINSVLNTISSIWSSIWNTVASVANTAWNTIWNIITAAINAVLNVINSVLNTIQNVWNGAWNAVSNFLSGAWNGIKDVVWSSINSVVDYMAGLPGRILGAISGIGNSLYNVGRDIINGLWNGLKSMWNSVTSWLSNLDPASWKGPPSRDRKMLINNGMLIMAGLDEGLRAGWKKTTGLLQSFVPDLAANIDSTVNVRTGSSLVSQSITDRNAAAAAAAAAGQKTMIDVGGVHVAIQPHPGMSRDDANRMGKDAGEAAARAIITAVGTV